MKGEFAVIKCKRFEQLPPIEWLSPVEAAHLMGISLRSFSKLLHDKAGPIPFVRVGRLIRIRKSDLDSWMEARRSRSAADRIVDSLLA